MQDELDEFFELANSKNKGSVSISKAAFCKARRHLSHTAFIELRNQLNKTIYSELGLEKWNGFRLCAIDGTRVNIPNNEATLAQFGGAMNNHGTFPQATISQCYDVLNGFTLDVEIDRFDASERDLAAKHVNNIEGNNLFLYDRGYPCYWLYMLHIAKQQHFCMRVTVGSLYGYVDDFVESKAKDAFIELKPHWPANVYCKKLGVTAFFRVVVA